MSYFDARFTCLQPTHTSISVLHNFTSSYLCSLSLPPTPSLPVVGKHLISSGLAPVLGPEKYPYLCENRKQIRSAPGHQGTRTYLTRQREQNPIQKLAPTQPHQMTLCIFSTICIKHCTSPHRSILVSRAAEAEPTGCRAESDLYRGIIIQCGGARVIIQCGSARLILASVGCSVDYIQCALDRVHWLHFCWPAAGTRSSSSCGPTTTTSGSSGPATSTSSSSGPAITGLSPDDEGKTGLSFVLLTLGQTITVALRTRDKGWSEGGV